MIDHITLNFKNYNESRSLYIKALDALGYKLLKEEAGVYCGLGIDKPTFWISVADREHPESINVHIAFVAKSKDEVNKFYEIAIANGGIDNGPSGYRDEYHKGYYAAYVKDINQNNIEVVYREDIDKENIFDVWNNCKKNTETNGRPNIKEGEIWWCRIGKNIGVEQDGKNENFRRPVLVVKKYSNEIVFVVPLSSQNKVSNWYYKFSFKEKMQVAVLNQAKPVDVKRFDQLMGTVADNTLINIRKAFIDLFGG